MIDIDHQAIEEYLDCAQLHGSRHNDWGEGYWIGRAVQHAHQNAVDKVWIIEALESRGLDSAVIALSKHGDPELGLN